MRRLSVSIEQWPVAGAFTIARGAKRHVDLVLVQLQEDGAIGRGEATPIYYHGETAHGVAETIELLRPAIEAGMTRAELAEALPRGAARNALDCALWDLEAKRSGVPAWRLAGLDPPIPLLTAYTISLGSPAQMEADARRAAARHLLLKIKLGGEGDAERVAAVRRGAPGARLIVDANEAWTGRDVAAEAKAIAPFVVELIEQPVKAGEDHLLDGVSSPIPLCADESCQDRADLAHCAGRYAAINIKLDKAGGLTEALALADAAHDAGMEIMVGCMLSTSLAIAPATLVAQRARWIDLDGPLLLARDRSPGLRFDDSLVEPPAAELWG